MSIVTEPAPAGVLALEPSWPLRALRWACWAALVGVMAILFARDTGHRPGLPGSVEVYRDIVYRRDGERRVRLDLYMPRSADPQGQARPAILALHGGGWRGGSRVEYGEQVARLAGHGYVVVVADYLLSKPGAPSWPDNLDDVREAVRWMRRHSAEYGMDPNRIAALGASAGGHLAALLGTASRPPGDASARVQAVIDFYGPADLLALLERSPEAGRSIALMLGGPPDPSRRAAYEAASPARLASPGAPPMLIVHGRTDPLVPPEQSEALALALRRAGVRHRLIAIDGARHGFGLSPQGRDLVPEILAFLDAVWNDKEEIP